MDNLKLSLFDAEDYDSILDFNSRYFVSHLITYIGNKRKLLPFLNIGINHVKNKLNKKELVSFDGFAGSGVVSRLLKYHSSRVISNDFEGYTRTINQAYLANTVQIVHLAEHYGWHAEGPAVAGTGLLTGLFAGLAAHQWRKYHKLHDKLHDC